MQLQTIIKNLTLLGFVVLSLGGYAQGNFTVTGTITTTDGEGLPGTTVILKGNSTLGTITDFEGNYKLSIPEGNHILVYSFIGYKTREKEVSGIAGENIKIDIELPEENQFLEEVIVVGYGSAKKDDVAGSVTSVTSEDFNQGVIAAPEQLLQGKVSGVQISTNSGEPGAGMNIAIRGKNSLRGSGNPLFVVDGIPLDGNSNPGVSGVENLPQRDAQNPLNFLDPADIKSIQVLKDASATAIYGSRAANGVVIIETKSGGAGAPSLTYSNYFSIATVANTLDLLDGDEYREQATAIDRESLILSSNGNIDWQDEIFRQAFSSSHNLSLSAGSEKSSFGVSLGMLDQEGIIKNNEYKRYTGKIYGKSKFFDDRLDLDVRIQASRIDNAGAPVSSGGTGGDLLTYTLQSNPTAESVSGYAPVADDYMNPVHFLDLYRDDTRTDRMLGSITSNIKIIDGLVITSKFATDISNGQRVVVTDPYSGGKVEELGMVYNGNNSNSSFLVDNYATYEKDFGNLNMKVMGGHSYQKFKSNNSYAVYRDILDLDVFNGGLADEDYSDTYDVAYQLQYLSTPVDWSGNFNEYDLTGYIGRVNLNWNDRYLLEASVRRDGSTKFTEENRYATFPSAALKWKISNEAFMQNVSFVDNLGLRGSWGKSGDQNIPAYSNIFLRYVPNNNSEGIDPIYGNPNLKWETTTQTNVGIDFSLFENKIYGNADYFVKTTEDLLTKQAGFLVYAGIPSTANTVWQNSNAVLESRGYEFLIGGFPISNDKITWDVSLNLTSVATIGKVIPAEVPLIGAIGGDGNSGAASNIYVEGEEFAFYLIEFLRFGEDGTAVYRDAEGNETTDFLQAGQKPMGSVFPDFTFGINSTLYVGNLDFTMAWNGARGLKMFNNTAAAFLKSGDFAAGKNTTVDVINSDMPIETPAGLGRSTYFLEDADFIRLNNLQIGYTFPKEILSKAWIKSCRVFVTGQNLLLFTNYSGYDPEVNTNMQQSDGFPTVGIDYSNYPKARTYSVGLNVTF